MNIINSIIIGVALMSLAVIIGVITRSFGNVDKKIAEDINSEKSSQKTGLLKRIQQMLIASLERFISILKKGIQRIHTWIIREGKKSKSDVVKAKEELIIKKDSTGDKKKPRNKPKIAKKVVKKIDKKKKNKVGQKNKKNKAKGIPKKSKQKNMENDIQPKDNFLGSSRTSDTSNDGAGIMDSVGLSNSKGKKSFIRGLFSTKKSKKKIDIKNDIGNSSKEWSLGSTGDKNNEWVTNGDSEADYDIKPVVKEGIAEKKIPVERNTFTADDEDSMIGVDRKVLEEKILQKINKDPKSLSNYHELGELYIKMKKYDDATEVFKYILTASPRDVEAKRRQDKIKLLKRLGK